MSNFTKSELEKAYANMQNIINKQEKKIKKLEQIIQDNENKYSENLKQLKEKYNTEIELLAGVDLENNQITESKSEHAIWLQSTRILKESASAPKWKRMFSDFERVVKNDIKNKRAHTSLSIKQRNAIQKGLKYRGIKIT